QGADVESLAACGDCKLWLCGQTGDSNRQIRCFRAAARSLSLALRAQAPRSSYSLSSCVCVCVCVALRVAAAVWGTFLCASACAPFPAWFLNFCLHVNLQLIMFIIDFLICD
ncbi:hypothetical protein GOODEAATRI_032938, partial [Goodea atripinnis]